MSAKQRISAITENLIQNKTAAISKAEAEEIAALPESAMPALLLTASEIAQAFGKSDIFTCSIINAKSGRCSQDCAFCSQSMHHNTKIAIYPLMDQAELVNRALEMDQAGASHFSIVTSGYALNESEIETICAATSEIRKKTGLTVCCSPGMLTKEQAEKLAASGVTNYHHNLETAESFFDRVCTTHAYPEDIEALEIASASGLNVCSGGILGLGESWGQRIELAFKLNELTVPRIPINFLNPIPGTRMAGQEICSPMEALKCIALFRFINPDRDITICGGREVILRDYQSWVFAAGANGIMVGNYLTTQGRDLEMDMEMIREWQKTKPLNEFNDKQLFHD